MASVEDHARTPQNEAPMQLEVEVEQLTPHWFCVVVVRRPWATLCVVAIVMLGSCAAGPLIHTPKIDTEIGAFRTRGTPIANGENTRYLIQSMVDNGALHTSPPRRPPAGGMLPGLDNSESNENLGRRLADAGLGVDGAGVVLNGSSSDNDRRRLQGSSGFQVCHNCWQNMDTIFSAGEEPLGGGNVLNAGTFHAICEWEESLMGLIDYPAHCARAGGECCLPQSLPRLLSSALGVPCALLSDDMLRLAMTFSVDGSIGDNAELVRQQFLDDTVGVDGNGIHRAWLTRSILCLDRQTYDSSTSDYIKQRKAMGKALLPVYVEVLEEKAAAGLPGTGVATHVFERQMFEQLFERQLLLDLNLAAAAMVILFVAMWLHTGSCCLSACGMCHILLSVPAAYSLYTVLGFTYFPYINLIGVFVVAGVGVDDVYVFHDAFSQSFVLLPPSTSLELRLSWALRRAATAMLTTSTTTSASFLANLVSPIPPIRVFGIFNGILIFTNYFFVITWFPTVVVLHDRYCANRKCCCCRRSVVPGSATTDTTKATVRSTQLADERVEHDEVYLEDEDLVGTVEHAKLNVSEHANVGAEWRRVEHIFGHAWADTLHRLRWMILALLVVAVAGAVHVVASRLRLATKQIQMMRSDHPMNVYADLIAHFLSSPHVAQDGMEVLVLSGIIPADTGDRYDNLDRGELVFDRDFDLSQPATQQWMLDLIDVVQSSPILSVDKTYPNQHPLERFGEWLGLQRVSSWQSCLVPDESDELDACTCANALRSHPLPSPDPHQPFIYNTLRGDIEMTVHDESWWGMSPALSLSDWGGELPCDVCRDSTSVQIPATGCLPHEIQWPGPADCVRLWLESQRNISLADHVLMRWRGTIEVQEADAGEWEFQISSDDGSMLYVDGALLLDNDGLHAHRSVQAVLQLSAGIHAITITFFEWSGGEFVQPMLRKTDGEESLRALSGSGYQFDLYTLGTRLNARQSILPISADAFRACLSDSSFESSGYNSFLWPRDSASNDPTDGIIVPWYVRTSQVGGWNYYEMSGYVEGWQQVLSPGYLPTNEGTAIGHGSFVTQYWFGVMDLQANLASSALIAMGISLLLACSVVGFATRSATTTLLATVSIFAVLSCTLATLILQGWELGILESMCLAILVGISCDFVVHLAYAYQAARSARSHAQSAAIIVRRERMRWALATMGISVLSAGGTTLVAAFALSNGQVEFFHAFGNFLMLTIGFGLLFSLVGFSTMAMAAGPTSQSSCGDSKLSKQRDQARAMEPGTQPAATVGSPTPDVFVDAGILRGDASVPEVEQLELVPQPRQ